MTVKELIELNQMTIEQWFKEAYNNDNDNKGNT